MQKQHLCVWFGFLVQDMHCLWTKVKLVCILQGEVFLLTSASIMSSKMPSRRGSCSTSGEANTAMLVRIGVVKTAVQDGLVLFEATSFQELYTRRVLLVPSVLICGPRYCFRSNQLHACDRGRALRRRQFHLIRHIPFFIRYFITANRSVGLRSCVAHELYSSLKR